jgi:hypothetical protein
MRPPREIVYLHYMINNDTDEFILFEKCIAFLHDIGIQTIFRAIDTNSFLPGLSIEKGIIIIDRQLLQHPGDLLHEAGHIAIVPAADRARLTENAIIKRRDREAEEIMAIAWSYAACVHLDIDPNFVFHEEGYKDGSAYIIDSCNDSSYLGLPMLQGIGMTADEKNAQRLHIPAYPYMIRWLRN